MSTFIVLLIISFNILVANGFAKRKENQFKFKTLTTNTNKDFHFVNLTPPCHTRKPLIQQNCIKSNSKWQIVTFKTNSVFLEE